MKLKPPFIQLLVTGLFVVGLLSCVKEDLSGCEVDPLMPGEEVAFSYYLSFTYTPYNEEKGEGYDPVELKSLTVYAFDAEGFFVKSVTDHSPRLGDEDYEVEISLLSGIYNFFAWGNADGCYKYDHSTLEQGVTSFQDVKLFYEGAVNDTVSVIPHPLFFSTIRDKDFVEHLTTRTEENDVIVRDTLLLLKNTNNLRFELRGLEMDNGSYRAVVTDNNASYNFDNTFASSKELHYTSRFENKNTHYYAEMICMKLARDRRPRLKLYDDNTGKILYEDNLVALILEGEKADRPVDFSIMHDFKILLEFVRDPITGSLGLTIKVNDWNVIHKYVTIN